MPNKKLLHIAKWTPTRSPSPGAIAYHEAVVNTTWHKDNIEGLNKILQNSIKDNEVVIDFGAGTGASALYFLKFLPKHIKLKLIDNSPSWLGQAYELLHTQKNVEFYILEKKEGKYTTLDEVFGKNQVNHVISANTVHLIPTISETFEGIYKAIKKGGTFTFQSGNIALSDKKKGVMMIDDSIGEIHDLAINIIREDKKWSSYRKSLDNHIEEQMEQRKFVFPTPRPLDYYLEIAKTLGFKNERVIRKHIKVAYKDWLNFLRVRRLQAGILPEVGGKDASSQEEKDRDEIIVKAALQLFDKLKKQNPLANASSFTAEWVYVMCEK